MILNRLVHKKPPLFQMHIILYTYWPRIYFTIYRVSNLQCGVTLSVVPAVARRRAKIFFVIANNKETHCFDYVCSNKSSASKNEIDALEVQYLNTFEMYFIIRIIPLTPSVSRVENVFSTGYSRINYLFRLYCLLNKGPCRLSVR